MIHKAKVRRTDREKRRVGSVYDGPKRYYDHNSEVTVVKLMTGDCYATADAGEMIVTILGSCVSVCMRDPKIKVGGMNHILLPGENQKKLAKHDPGYSTRFGIFAMEELINKLLKLGAKKERLEVKIFGGGNVINNSAMIGTKNIKFVKAFLKDENLKICSQDVGGESPRRIHYFPDTGKLMMRKLKRKDDNKIVEEETKYQRTMSVENTKAEEVELF